MLCLSALAAFSCAFSAEDASLRSLLRCFSSPCCSFLRSLSYFLTSLAFMGLSGVVLSFAPKTAPPVGSGDFSAAAGAAAAAGSGEAVVVVAAGAAAAATGAAEASMAWLLETVEWAVWGAAVVDALEMAEVGAAAAGTDVSMAEGACGGVGCGKRKGAEREEDAGFKTRWKLQKGA